MNSTKIFSTVSEIPAKDWNKVLNSRNIYLSLPYLSSLESAMRSTMGFYYGITYNPESKPIVISSFQIVPFKDKRKAYTEELCFVANHLSQLSKKLMNVDNLNALVCGDVFCNGENGFIWTPEVTLTEAIVEVDKIAELLKAKKEVKSKTSMTVFKEFWPASTPHTDVLKKWNYREFMIDVNMVLKIHPDWRSMEDYLQSMKTKFRTKAKSVYKKSSKLICKDFSSEDITHHQKRIEELFGNVLAKSDFSYGTLSIQAFVNFKEALQDSFSFKGFFLDTKLVGFSTAFFNASNMEATYVGMDYEYNQEHSVYQRMLYDFVEQALARNAQELQLGRTAELLKSSIGALPTNMKLYVKHRKSFPNLLLKPILESITPSEFELRKPFKANFSN